MKIPLRSALAMVLCAGIVAQESASPGGIAAVVYETVELDEGLLAIAPLFIRTVPGTRIEVVLQTSDDGETWTDFAAPIYDTARGYDTAALVALPAPAEAPFIRYRPKMRPMEQISQEEAARRRAVAAMAGAGGGAGLLLDTYTGAVGAYALDYLSSSYSGDVVELRRSGDDALAGFTPTELGDGTATAWVAAGGGTELGYVRTWYDQSGNSNDASQSSDGRQPLLVQSGAVNADGLYFAESRNDRFDTPLVQSDVKSIFAAVVKDVGSDTSRGFVRGDAFGASPCVFAQGAVWRYFPSGTAPSGHTVTSAALVSFRHESGSQVMRYNGGGDATASSSYSPGSTAIVVGEGYTSLSLDGHIAEILFFSDFKDSTDTAGIEAEINSRHSLY